MILNEQHIQSITNEDGVYQCCLINRRFAHLYFGEDTSPIGNVIVFESKTEIGSLILENALIICGELPNISMFGGVCFQRLYATQLGSLLSVITGKEYFVDESCIFTDGVQASLSITNRVKDSVAFHIIFPIESVKEELYSLILKEEDMNTLKENAIEAFKHLIKSIFLETQRDNF
jgi:hypothetical protein